MKCCDENGSNRCKYFQSMEEYYEDPSEPYYLGRCLHPDGSKTKETYLWDAGYTFECKFWHYNDGDEKK